MPIIKDEDNNHISHDDKNDNTGDYQENIYNKIEIINTEIEKYENNIKDIWRSEIEPFILGNDCHILEKLSGDHDNGYHKFFNFMLDQPIFREMTYVRNELYIKLNELNN
jgi:hypothetical protein